MNIRYRILIHIPACGRRYNRNVNHDTRIGETSDARPHPHSNGVSATPILFSGKPNFAVRDRRGKNGRCRSNVLRQRPKLSGAPFWGAGRTNSLVAGSSPTSSTTHSRATGDSPFVEMPINSGPLRARVPVFDKVSWSDTPTFHNTLVVGSSPTSSTTQSRATGDFRLMQPANGRDL